MSEGIIHRLLQACTRGPNQQNLVNELIETDMVLYAYAVPAMIPGYGHWVYVGDTRLQYSSWKNLKKRMIQAGFTVKYAEDWKAGRRKIVVGLGMNK